MAVAAALGPLGLWVRAIRWRYLFPPASRPPALVAAMMIGYMVNNVLPLRAGEVARVYVVARRWGHGFWTTVATVVVERVLDGLAVVLILGVLVLVVPVPGYLRWGAAIMLAFNLVGVAMLVSFAAAPGPSRAVLRWLTRRWPRVQSSVLPIFERFLRGLEGIRTPAHSVPLLLWTVVVWVVPAFAAWTMLRAMTLSLPFPPTIPPLHRAWVASWVVLAFVGVSVSLPSAPGFVGVFHAAAVLALGIFGVPRAEGLGYALVLHAVQYVPVTLVGWLFLLREHVTLAEATHAD